jgi:MoaA/NifB/PqqE/SkfB family radical SAM enzyme
MSDKSHQKLICIQPFVWCEIHADGSVFACCPSWVNVPLGNLLRDSFDCIWNGPVAMRLRQSVLDGSFSLCDQVRCPCLAGRQAPVMPQDAVPLPYLREVLRRNDLHLPFGPRQLNLCYDARCNLACPSCRKGLVRVGGRYLGRIRQIEVRLKQAFGPSVEEITVSGYGDPFGSPSYLAFLQNLDTSDFPRLHTLRLHTNAQLWDASAWEGLGLARALIRSAEISVDAASAPTYAENRRGGDFGCLLHNLAFIATLGLRIRLSFVVQRNNFRQMPAFAALAKDFGFSAYFSQLSDWGTFSGEDYRHRAVHNPGHTEHEAFKDIARRLVGVPGVDLGNLLPLLADAQA